MYLGLYGGMMRGGNTDSTVVVADAPIEAPPVVSHTWSAIAMHDEFWAPVEAKLRPGGLVLVNDTTFTSDVARRRHGAPRRRPPPSPPSSATRSAASMVMLGAFARDHRHRRRATRWSRRCAQSIPSYRTQHIAANERALRAGWDLLPANAFPAWESRACLKPNPDRTIKSRGTVTIDVEHCKGCDLCIPACPPGVLAMSTAVNHMGYRYPELLRRLHRLRGVPATCAPTSCSRCSASRRRS